ncbi:MAG: hypothetical protein MUF22_01545 [Chitinispirillaceae bacterium]|jgi:hypothetical protein|nr:hypothetical protein [Chitinispirillaceae bacterium]
MKPAGTILKIKQGYNPNSSSLGTAITWFVLGSAGATLLLNALFAAAISFRQKKKNGKIGNKGRS